MKLLPRKKKKQRGSFGVNTGVNRTTMRLAHDMILKLIDSPQFLSASESHASDWTTWSSHDHLSPIMNHPASYLFGYYIVYIYIDPI